MIASRQAYGHTTQRNRGRRAGGEVSVTPFVPTDIADIRQWYEIGMGTLFQEATPVTAAGVGDPVGYFGDDSGITVHNITQSTTSSKPTVQADGAVKGDGGDSLVSVDAIFAGSENRSIYIVAKKVTPSTDGICAWGDDASGAGGVFSITSEIALRVISGSLVWDASLSGINYQIISIILDGTDVSDVLAYLDNVQLGVSSLSDQTLATVAGFMMCGHLISNFSDHSIKAVLAYGGAHTPTQRTQINEYLASQFGITI